MNEIKISLRIWWRSGWITVLLFLLAMIVGILNAGDSLFGIILIFLISLPAVILFFCFVSLLRWLRCDKPSVIILALLVAIGSLLLALIVCLSFLRVPSGEWLGIFNSSEKVIACTPLLSVTAAVVSLHQSIFRFAYSNSSPNK